MIIWGWIFQYLVKHIQYLVISDWKPCFYLNPRLRLMWCHFTSLLICMTCFIDVSLRMMSPDIIIRILFIFLFKRVLQTRIFVHWKFFYLFNFSIIYIYPTNKIFAKEPFQSIIFFFPFNLQHFLKRIDFDAFYNIECQTRKVKCH